MEPVVLVPGLNCTGKVFSPLVDGLWRHGPVVLANHTRGSSVSEIASAVLEQAPPRFALGGFSMGGYIAFAMLRQAPERITRLALIDTMARPDTEEQREKRRRAIALTSEGKFSRVLKELFPRTVDPARRDDAALEAFHRSMAEALGPDTYIRHQTAIMNRPDARPDLAGISCPTAIVVGAHDEVTPVTDAQAMAEAIPSAALTVVADAGHFALIERPDPVIAALDRWMTA